MGHHHPGMNRATLRPPRPVHPNGWASLQVPHDQTALAGLPIARRRISIMRMRELCRYIYSVHQFSARSLVHAIVFQAISAEGLYRRKKSFICYTNFFISHLHETLQQR